MRVDQKERVSEAFCEVMEKLAFMFGELTPKTDLPQTGSTYIQASMTFIGDMTGTLSLMVPEALGPVITANVLGMEPDDELVVARAMDTLKEVLNVTCGQVLIALAGERPIFDLSIPAVSRLDRAEWSSLVDDPETLGFLVDDNPVLLRLSLEDGGGQGSKGSRIISR
jgi:CheY-specific phosphatase CheX